MEVEQKQTPPIINAAFDSYHATLCENSRPPSRGGNTKAWHRHRIVVDGKTYSFRALGTLKWAYVGDRVSFEWEWDESETYRNVITSTFRAVDKNGKPVKRGLRGSKKWRSSAGRAPGRRSD